MKKLPSFRSLIQALQSGRHVSPQNQQPQGDEIPSISESITDTGYYNEISFKYHSAQIICIMLLAVFLAVSLMTDAGALSADNLIYFVKDLSTTITDREKEAKDTFVYASDENNAYTLYREGLVVLGRQKLTFFTATGREAQSYLLTYQNPRLASSGRYLAAFDMGGKRVCLYNSFTCVNDITTEHAVRSVAICNKGYYCLITDGAEYASEVLLYNDRHNVINRYRLEEYTIMADLRQDAAEVMLVSVSSELGRMITHIDFAIPGQGEWGNSFEVMDAYPVDCHYTEDGNVCLLTTDALYIFSAQGQELTRYSLATEGVISFRETEDRQILVCRNGVSDQLSGVLVFDKMGNLEYNVSAPAAVKDVYCLDGILAVLCDGALFVYREGVDDAPEVIDLKGNYHTLLAYSNEEFLLCGDAKAITVKP